MRVEDEILARMMEFTEGVEKNKKLFVVRRADGKFLYHGMWVSHENLAERVPVSRALKLAKKFWKGAPYRVYIPKV